MALLLHINTAVQSASVCLSKGRTILGVKTNPSERESAAWLHLAINELLQENNLTINQLHAIAVSGGPGSYTGLRVGMSTAKGLCYAFTIPLIIINTLKLMASSVEQPTTDLLCPMIDARRMEVFTALYDRSLMEEMKPINLVVDENSFNQYLETKTISFFGNGSDKLKSVLHHPNAYFGTVSTSAANMVELALERFDAKQFSDLAYSEPFYIKDFHSAFPKKNY